jgi:hypothetical protein
MKSRSLATTLFALLTTSILVACASEDDAKSKDAPLEEQPTSCADVGGSCVAVVPDACANGEIVEASCGGGIGATCCVPKKKDDPKPATCESAGGSCVALVPGACANGTLGDASKFPCGDGGIGAACCLPN